MTIRRATQEEVHLIKSYGEKVRIEASLGYLANSPYAADELKGFNDYLISEENGVLQGWVLVGESFDFYTSQPTGMILELYVFKEFRNKGLGKKLVHTAVSYFKHIGLNRVHLNVFAGNHAKKLYEKLGFHEVSTVMEKKI
ncbi:GNAT family N-acetyltransferase [Bacillus sp. PS06]|uniref:GNAT family N-acetyltransferase n=1 Tax=Bacillus sp. PS06 TaxID=2764176 RepID=UPI001786B26F|nr:GNAT family N-acetyltransferase [Bacillus sp. PS06]MBD8070364.1 GNAT family N-acetyltransferase [Bacillus sp. PS06]